MTEKTELDISVEEVTHAVAEITKMDVVIAQLHQKYDKVIFEVDKPEGMTAAKEARKEVREPRYFIENLRKDGKRPILALGKQLDGRAAEMTERLMAIEMPIHESIKEEETRVERERQAKIDAEAVRVESIQEKIHDIRASIERVHAFGIPDVKQVSKEIEGLERLPIDQSFGEFADQAEDAKVATLAKLREVHTAAVEREAEQTRLNAERAELEELRDANEKREAQVQARRKRAEAKAREKRDAAEKKQREELEAQRKKQAAAQKKIDEESARLATERADLEREQRKEADRKAAEEKAEQDRKDAAQAAAKNAKYPGTDEIIRVLATHFSVPTNTVRGWLTKLSEAA